jgi:plastocyanin
MGRSLAALLCAGLVVGCGGEGERASRALTVESGKTIRVVGKEYSLHPSRIVVTGAVGETTLRIALDNEGTLAHNVRVFRGDRELGGTPTFQGGQSRSGTVRLPPGSYRMICTVGDHAALGMHGRLELR